MKQILFYTLTVCITGAFTSCYKTYTCKDVYGNPTGEVKAISKQKAHDRCKKNGSATAE